MYTLDICGICRDDLTSDIKVLDCKHGFHAECIDSWTARCRQCPYCRQPVIDSLVNREEEESDTDDDLIISAYEDSDDDVHVFSATNWIVVSVNSELSEQTMDTYMRYRTRGMADDVILIHFCIFQKMSESFIRQNLHVFGSYELEMILLHQTLSHPFIEELTHRLHQ